jgi:hypothetical protein
MLLRKRTFFVETLKIIFLVLAEMLFVICLIGSKAVFYIIEYLVKLKTYEKRTFFHTDVEIVICRLLPALQRFGSKLRVHLLSVKT